MKQGRLGLAARRRVGSPAFPLALRERGVNLGAACRRLVSLPRKEDLTFQVEITAIDSPMPELYKTLVFSIQRRGTIMD